MPGTINLANRPVGESVGPRGKHTPAILIVSDCLQNLYLYAVRYK